MYTDIEEMVRTLRNIEVVDPNTNLFGVKINCAPRDVAFIFLQIKEKYGVDIEKAVSLISNYTLANLVHASWESIPDMAQR